MRIAVVTIFPSLFRGLLSEGIVARALEKNLVKIEALNLRDFTSDSYKSVDDYPYGGGPGMVMKPEPILKAVASVTGVDYLTECSQRELEGAGFGKVRGSVEGDTERGQPARGVSGALRVANAAPSARAAPVADAAASADAAPSIDIAPLANVAPSADGSPSDNAAPLANTAPRIVILSPQGKKYDQILANELSGCESIVLICGRYKAIDERVTELLGAEEISIGDYVLSGGELPAMVIVESIVRLIPGAMEDEDSAAGDSFEDGILDCAYYTRPETVAGKKVPEVLISGNHEAIRKWRRKNRILRTLERRADLLENACLGEEDRKLLRECENELGPGR